MFLKHLYIQYYKYVCIYVQDKQFILYFMLKNIKKKSNLEILINRIK